MHGEASLTVTVEAFLILCRTLFAPQTHTVAGCPTLITHEVTAWSSGCAAATDMDLILALHWITLGRPVLSKVGLEDEGPTRKVVAETPPTAALAVASYTFLPKRNSWALDSRS